MKAMIFAAGLGTRLRPITDTKPKALVEVAGVPMLERVIRKVAAAGIRSIVINTHHFSSQIRDFLDSRDNFGLDISLSDEQPEALETGGAIRRAAPLLGGEGSFLIHNADILSDLDLPSFIRGERPGALATLLVSSRDTTRYLLFDDDMRLAGWTDTRTGEVRSPYRDFRPENCRRLSFAGIHILSEAALPLMTDWPEKFSIMDFYLHYAAEYPIAGLEKPGLRLIDVGSPERLGEACRASFVEKV